ncbi:hypothetical protein Caka_0564 [Coraliomargarita akajimensis DSM 45221]|uniref:Uncharacterized protein n=2 Tax=Coraliomargarita TaxID=442430 RepID=D5ENT0_CORAD|nr:hypothetical protein Caka_0564 [Coraliomargarita akajimensis DSM 45221]
MTNQINYTTSIFLLVAALLCTATASANLNPALLGIAQALDEQDSQITGKAYTADLTLKVATEKFLIFSDAYLPSKEEDSNYQIAKWIFTPEQTQPLKGKRGTTCRVRFKVEKLNTQAPYSDMPHIVATILSIEPLDR